MFEAANKYMDECKCKSSSNWKLLGYFTTKRKRDINDTSIQQMLFVLNATMFPTIALGETICNLPWYPMLVECLVTDPLKLHLDLITGRL